MNNFSEVTWRGIRLGVCYYNGSDFYPTSIVAIDCDGEEGAIKDDILPDISEKAVWEIGQLILDIGRDAA